MNLQDYELQRMIHEQIPGTLEESVAELLKKYGDECGAAREVYAKARESAVRRAMMELELMGVDLTSMIRGHLIQLCRVDHAGEPLRKTTVTYADRELQLEIYS